MSSSRRGLGRGLDALLPDAEERTELPIGEIRPRPDQPRQRFAEKELTELAYSIRLHGILQPLVVAPAGDHYELIAGERRLRAAKLAGLSNVPVHIRTSDEQHHYELALIENLQRADLSPVEEARAFAKLMTQADLTQDELAKRLGKSRSAIANSVRLLALPATVLSALEERRLTPGHANALLSQPESVRGALFQAILERGLTVRQAEQWGGPKKAGIPPDLPPWLRDLERHLGTRLTRRGSDSKGALTIHYGSREELEALLKKLAREEEG